MGPGDYNASKGPQRFCGQLWDNYGYQRTQQVEGTTIGRGDHKWTAMGHGDHYGAQGPQWDHGTTMGPGDHNGSRGPQWVHGRTKEPQ